MSKQKPLASSRQSESAQSKSVFWAVAVCFLLSGFAALLYQAAWMKSLSIVFGTSHIAVATVLAAYMAGLATGAAVAARYAYRVLRPVLVYGVLEAVIGVTALLVPLLLIAAQKLLVLIQGHQPFPAAADGFGQTLYYLIATFLILGIPTGAMGATLPLLTRYAVTNADEIGPRVGLLYGINTVGAVIGALLAGFFLLPYVGLLGTLMVGAVTNVGIFFVAARLAKTQIALEPKGNSRSADAKGIHWIMPVMLVSGVVSFTLEVFWTRLLSHIFGGTVYAFSIMLACFLAGIALGGLAAGRLATDQQRSRFLFSVAQVFIALTALGSYWVLQWWVPEGRSLVSSAAYAALVMLPTTVFIGATYPLAVRIATGATRDTANTSGRVYAWNTVGAITGALLAGFVILPELGFGKTLKLAVMVSLGLALVVAVASHPRNRMVLGSCLVLALGVGLIVKPVRPDRLIYFHALEDPGTEYFYGVGRSATILMREKDGFINLSSNGLSESAVGRVGMPPFNLSQKWLAGLPTLARPNAESMLIIGYGGGIALEGVAPHVTDVDVVELEPMVIAANRSVANLRGEDPLERSGVRLIINDARNAMTLTDKRYDVIVSQPSHPWTGGAAYLYTSEFLLLSKQHLQDDGVFLQWINSQFLDESLLQTLSATVAEQFKYVELYQPEPQVLMFLASDSPINLWQANMGSAQALQQHAKHYNRLGVHAVEDAVAMLTLDDAGVRAFSTGAPLNTDNHNRLAYFSRSTSTGLSASDLQDLFANWDPLTNGDSELRKNHEFALHHVMERLLQGNFTKRAAEFAKATKEPSVKMTLDALGLDHGGESGRASQLLRRALESDPDNEAAQQALLRLFLGAIAQRNIPQHIADLANQQTGPIRSVLEGWVYGSSGNFGNLRQLDGQLAQVTPTSPLYPVAVKLRVDWRIDLARKARVDGAASGNLAYADEALTLLDDLLASYWNLDLYILRAGCALVAGRGAEFVESASAVARQVQGKLRLAASSGGSLSDQEAAYIRSRLQGMSQQLLENSVDAFPDRIKQVQTELKKVIAQL